MPASFKFSRVLQSLILGLAVMFALASAQARAQANPAKTAQSASTSAAAAIPSDPKYVGSETCKTCHEEIYNAWEKTPHWKTMQNKVPSKQGCEGCHGPGADHVAGGGDKSKIFLFASAKPEEVTARCLTCHQYGEEHANFARSEHNTNGVVCTSCHSPHHAKEPQYLLVEKQPTLCYTCHTEVKQDFSRPFRHRVDQGLIQCTDCHNQHGGFLTKQLRSTAAQDQVCFKCHVDKAGPFAYEHEPVKTEGCISCHTPHGSTNPRLLKRTQVNLLCLECHTLTTDAGAPALPSFHNQSQKYSACTMCHTQVHGSNFSSFFFQ
jgi:DmsE family decaheme c-type cytochrome